MTETKDDPTEVSVLELIRRVIEKWPNATVRQWGQHLDAAISNQPIGRAAHWRRERLLMSLGAAVKQTKRGMLQMTHDGKVAAHSMISVRVGKDERQMKFWLDCTCAQLLEFADQEQAVATGRERANEERLQVAEVIRAHPDLLPLTVREALGVGREHFVAAGINPDAIGGAGAAAAATPTAP